MGKHSFILHSDCRHRIVTAVAFGCAVIILTLVAGTAFADKLVVETECYGPVKEVRFEGNEVTLDKTLLQRLDIRAGIDCTGAGLEAGRQAIMNTGLFKSVRASFDAASGTVTYTVRERIYRFLLPRLSRSADGDIRAGAQVRFDNVMGLNHKLRITARREEGSGNSSGNQLSMRYQIPRFFNSDFGLSWGVTGVEQKENTVVDTETVGRVRRNEYGTAIIVSRYLEEQSALSGWRVDFGLVTGARNYSLISGDIGTLESGAATELRLAGTYNDVQLEEYRRRGREYGISLAIARDSLAGDFSYNRLDLFYRGYVPLQNPRVLENLNYQVRFGAASDASFGDPSYQIGGSRSLRGFEKNLLRGNTMAVFNGEYLRSLEANPRLRWAVISDFAAVKGDGSWRLADLRASLGTGLRWKIRSLVNTDLNLDLAYGFGNGGGKARFYFGTKVIF
jgi:outer membrane protein assembly factor BamA